MYAILDVETTGLNARSGAGYIHPYPDNKDVQVIIKGYLRRNKKLQVVKIVVSGKKKTLHARSNTG